MAQLPVSRQRWTPPAARLEGDRLLKARAAQQRVRDAAIQAEAEAKVVEVQAEKQLAETVDELEKDLKTLIDNIPKIMPASGGGRRTIKKILDKYYNLPDGLGSAAGHDAADFATAAQGLLADSAVQLADLAPVATSGDYDDLSNKPTLGTAAAADVGDFATAAQGALADGAAQKANNLSDLGDADEARINLAVREPFATKALAEAFAPIAAPDFIHIAGYTTAGDGGGALYKKAASEPAHEGKFSITLVDAVTVVWYEIAELILTERMFGAPCDGQFDASTAVGTDATTMLQNWAGCPVSNHKRFTGVSRITDTVDFPAGTLLEGNGAQVGVTGKQITTYSGVALITSIGTDFTQISDLTVDATKGDTRLTISDTTGLTEEYYVCIYNPTDFSWANYGTGRESYRAGEWVRIQRVVDSTKINLYQPLWDSYVKTAVDLYLMRSPQTIFRDFRIETPVTEYKAGWKISTQVAPRVVNVTVNGLTEYAGGVFERCVDYWIEGQAIQRFDDTSNNEYGVVTASCHGGEVHGHFYAMRHALSFGNSDFVGCVPNRNIVVYANTYDNAGAASSVDFGHGCSEGLTLMGGTHGGVSIGGANHRFIGCRFRKGEGWGDGHGGGRAIAGGEFVKGTFVFDNCEIESFSNPGLVTGNPGTVNISLTAGPTGKLRFIFTNCRYTFHVDAAYGIKIQNNGCTQALELIVDGADILAGAGLSYFVRIVYTSGTANWDRVRCVNVRGLGSTIPPVALSGAATATKWELPAQEGVYTLAGNTGASSANAQVDFPWAYPTGVTPTVWTQLIAATLGGDRCVTYPTSKTNLKFAVVAATTDAGNFASTATGDIQWRATVN